MSRPAIDRLFLALLLLDATVTALFLARAGLGVIGSVLSIGTVTGGLVPGLVAIKFLLNSVLLLGAARRQAPLAGPSQAFLLLAAGGFLCLALGLGRGFLTAAWTQAPLAGLLPGLLAATLLLLGFRNLGRLWRFYQQESLILLSGAWVLLFGSVGVDILGRLFPTTGQMGVVGTALGGFCQMTGASILLYGVLRFALRKKRLNRFLRPVRC